MNGHDKPELFEPTTDEEYEAYERALNEEEDEDPEVIDLVILLREANRKRKASALAYAAMKKAMANVDGTAIRNATYWEKFEKSQVAKVDYDDAMCRLWAAAEPMTEMVEPVGQKE